MDRRQFIVSSSAAIVIGATADIPSAALSQPPSGSTPGFNDHMIAAVEMLASSRAGGGYGGPRPRDMSYAFTRNLSYPGSQSIPQSPATAARDAAYTHATMCVAAVAEVMIEAINDYEAKRKGKPGYVDPAARLPLSMMTRSSLTSLRPYLWIQSDENDVFRYSAGEVPRARSGGRIVSALSRGSAHAFSIFGMGEELPFGALRKGDVVNLNRTSGSGHAVIFWNYIGADNKPSSAPAGAIGFTYFSAQGPKLGSEGGGFAFRDAYFAAHSGASTGHKKDPGVILRQDPARRQPQLYLNTGRLWMPEHWRAVENAERIRQLVRSRTAGAPATRDADTDRLIDTGAGPIVTNFAFDDEV